MTSARNTRKEGPDPNADAAGRPGPVQRFIKQRQARVKQRVSVQKIKINPKGSRQNTKSKNWDVKTRREQGKRQEQWEHVQGDDKYKTWTLVQKEGQSNGGGGGGCESQWRQKSPNQ